MNDLITAAFSNINIVPTFLLALVTLYWITVIIGALDMGFLDFDIDVDIDADVDADVDVSAGWLNEVLSFFNIGRVPFMVFFTALVMPMWFISINLNHALGVDSFGMSLLFLIPNFIVSLFLAKFVTIPFAGIFDRLNDDAMGRHELVGKSCIVTLSCDNKSIGQVEVRIEGESFILNAKTREGIELSRGASAVVVEQISGSDIYIVAPFNQV